jgi:hypothetical protein
MQNEFVKFFGSWGYLFYRFMVGLGGEIIMAVIYISLGISFLAVGLQLPPEVVQESVARHGGMTLFLLVASTATVMQMIKFTLWLIAEGKEEVEAEVEAAAKAAATTAKPKPGEAV